MQNQIRVGIVDPHEIVRHSLKIFLESTDDLIFAGETDSVLEIVILCQRNQPDVILIDFLDSKMKGLEIIENLYHLFPTVSLIVLTTLIAPEQVMRALRAGVAGYLYKQVDIDTLAEAIRSVFRGESSFDDEVKSILVARSEILEHFRPMHSLN